MVNDMGKIQNRILNTDSIKEFGIAVKPVTPSSLSLLHRRHTHTHNPTGKTVKIYSKMKYDLY